LNNTHQHCKLNWVHTDLYKFKRLYNFPSWDDGQLMFPSHTSVLKMLM